MTTLQDPEHRFTQYHNQAVGGTLHRNLVALWDAVRHETGGRVETQVFAENNRIAGSDPAALKLLLTGEIQFFTLMGGILGTVVPAAEVQQVPFAFGSAGEAHAAMDGPLGSYLVAEMAANGIQGFPVGAFDNGMRQVGASRAIVEPGDLAGLKIRVPAGQMIFDTFRALGAEPVTINVDGIHDGLRTGKVDAQENPLAIMELFRLYEVATHVSMTNHIWSGFNFLANRPLWLRLPEDIRAVIERNVATHVRRQREEQGHLNAALRQTLAARGLLFNDVDPAPFRASLAGVYATWKVRLGSQCWSLLEAARGPLG